MKIGDRIYVRGYVDEIRKDTVIVRNDGGYFGTTWNEVTPSAQPEPIKIDLSGYSKEDWERVKKEWGNTPITVLSAQPKTGKWISADAMFHGVPFYCSECGENTRDTVMGKPRWKFCPMCGSRNEVTE